MHVLVALDKFKEALPATAACAAVASALRERHPGWTFDLCPLTDGGDGFVAALAADGRGRFRRERVTGPLGEPVDTTWAFVPAPALPPRLRPLLAPAGAPLALLEMAACSGLALVPRERRDVRQSTSRGVGELISAAARAGAGSVLLGVGGSATNDLGLGALFALGWRALDANGRDIGLPLPRRFAEIARLLPPAADAPPPPPVWIACDVDNPLCGPRGATFTYGPQKGLADDELAPLDAQLARLAGLLAEAVGASPAVFSRPGAGAAGGIVAGLMAACGARPAGGFALVSEWLDLERRVAAADLVVTGEGRFDDGSLQGKGPGGLVRASLAAGKRTIVLTGKLQIAHPPAGLELAEITPEGMPLDEALPATARLLAEAARRIA